MYFVCMHIADMSVCRSIGIGCAIGIFLAVIANLTFTPALLLIFPKVCILPVDPDCLYVLYVLYVLHVFNVLYVLYVLCVMFLFPL
jgi:hypothetical protein